MNLLRALIVDDSVHNRERVAAILGRSSVARVVGMAQDGAEALTLLDRLEPDVVILDLEMPRMDGYGFLRFVMNTHPLAVIVLSGHARKENVFRALELGALDFVDKGALGIDAASERMLLDKLEQVRSARRPSAEARVPLHVPQASAAHVGERAPEFVVAFAASTGGPTALTTILTRLSAPTSYAVLIAQHMPALFTATFAQRMDRLTHFRAREAEDGELLRVGMALVCPGDRCLELARGSDGQLRVKVAVPEPGERVIPNATRLLGSVAQHMGRRGIGVVLTGMGDDGAIGAAAIALAGGSVLVESEETAVVPGMPRAARALVPSARELHTARISDELERLVRT
jgi:two-component system, chemotaxis family, protein-glutamate methylesterase/glutaminase